MASEQPGQNPVYTREQSGWEVSSKLSTAAYYPRLRTVPGSALAACTEGVSQGAFFLSQSSCCSQSSLPPLHNSCPADAERCLPLSSEFWGSQKHVPWCSYSSLMPWGWMDEENWSRQESSVLCCSGNEGTAPTQGSSLWKSVQCQGIEMPGYGHRGWRAAGLSPGTAHR